MPGHRTPRATTQAGLVRPKASERESAWQQAKTHDSKRRKGKEATAIMNTTTTNNQTHPQTNLQTHHPVDYQQPLAAPLSSEDAEALTAAVLNSSYSNRMLGTAEDTRAPKSVAENSAALVDGSVSELESASEPAPAVTPALEAENIAATVAGTSAMAFAPEPASEPASEPTAVPAPESAMAAAYEPASESASESAAAVTSNPASAPASATAAAMGAPQRCTYRDCLMGRANIPVHGPGKAAFTLLMVGGMVTFMATFNGVLSSGLGFFAHAHWMYPLVFCIAFLMRLYVGDRFVGFAAPRYVIPHFHGLARNIAMTLLNVVVMGAIMGSIITLLLKGPAGFWGELASTLPLTMTVAALVNYFVVGPAVKMIYNNVLEPTNGLGLFNWAQRYAMPWTAIFGN